MVKDSKTVIDNDDWYKISDKKPTAYDLVLLKKDFFTKSIPGWWTGSGFAGMRVKDGEKFEFWKRVKA